jgi:hypothetical protein
MLTITTPPAEGPVDLEAAHAWPRLPDALLEQLLGSAGPKTAVRTFR